MKMSQLPLDLVEEILSRVPAIFLKRFRPTCKRWNALFKDRKFREKHLRKASKQSLLLMVKDYRLCSINVNINVVPPSIEFKSSLDLKDSHIAEVFNCDGLLLCTTKEKGLVVWNPCSGDTKWVQPKTAGGKRFFRYALGYENENNNSCRSYKILRLGHKYYKLDGFEIYEFDSNSWRVVNDMDHHSSIRGDDGISLKGNTYWLASYQMTQFLLCFDYTTEKSRRLSLPPYDPCYCDWMAPSLVGEDRLSVLKRTYGSSMMEMWVTGKIETSEAALSWSKSFSMADYEDYVSASLLIDEEKKVALCCRASREEFNQNVVYTIGEEDKYYKQVPYVESTYNLLWLANQSEEESTDKPWFPYFFNYVPSLAQIQ